MLKDKLKEKRNITLKHLKDKNLSHTDIFVFWNLLILQTFSNSDQMPISMTRLSSIFSLNVKTLRKSLDRFEKLGLITRIYRIKKGDKSMLLEKNKVDHGDFMCTEKILIKVK